MHLLIAREAVDEHLKAAGDLAVAGRRPAGQGPRGRGASGFYARWLPSSSPGPGRCRRRTASSGRSPGTCASSSGRRAGWRARRSTGCRGGRPRWSTTSGSSAAWSTSARSCSRWPPPARGPDAAADDPARGRSAQRLADAFCGQARLRVEVLFDELWTNTDVTDRKLAAAVLAGDVSWLEEGVLDPSEGTGPGSPVGARAEQRRSRSGARCAELLGRLRSSSAICTALSAAPLRRLSPTTKRLRPLPSGAAWSARTRPTKTSSRPVACSGLGTSVTTTPGARPRTARASAG